MNERGDGDANDRIYGEPLTPREIVVGDRQVPARARPLIDLLNRQSPANLSSGPETP